MECPEECPYIVPSDAFSCVFKCMKKEELTILKQQDVDTLEQPLRARSLAWM